MCIQLKIYKLVVMSNPSQFYALFNKNQRPTPKPTSTNMTDVRFEDCTLKLKSFVRVDSKSKLSDVRDAIIEKLQNICTETKQG